MSDDHAQNVGTHWRYTRYKAFRIMHLGEKNSLWILGAHPIGVLTRLAKDGTRTWARYPGQGALSRSRRSIQVKALYRGVYTPKQIQAYKALQVSPCGVPLPYTIQSHQRPTRRRYPRKTLKNSFSAKVQANGSGQHPSPTGPRFLKAASTHQKPSSTP